MLPRLVLRSAAISSCCHVTDENAANTVVVTVIYRQVTRTLEPAFNLISSSPIELFMIGDSGVNEMKDTTLTLYPSVLDDNSRSFFHLQDQKRANAVNSFGSDRCDKAHQEDGVGGEENDIDSLVAQDLNSLSMAERERILLDSVRFKYYS